MRRFACLQHAPTGKVVVPELPERESSAAADRRWFTTTSWSVVLSARHQDSSRSAAALATLCETYWFPLYAYVRRLGFTSHDAQDLTQAFFARLLEKDSLKDVDHARGKFRSFLLAALKNFLSHERERARAAKRGGGRVPFSLDLQDAEDRYRREPADLATPERVYQRRWALTLLEQVLRRLEDEQTRIGKGQWFAGLKPFLTAGKESRPYRQVAEKLGLTEGAVKVAVHRLRQRYRELLKDEIAQTVADASEIEDELRDLLAAVGAT